MTGVWTKEANEEADKLLSAPATLFSLTGKCVRTTSREAGQTLYMMTKKPDKNSKIVPRKIIQMLKDLKPNEITMSVVSDLILDYGEGPQFECNDIMNLNATDIPYYNKAVKTTIGKYLMNRIIFEPVMVSMEASERDYFNDRMKSPMFNEIIADMGYRVQDGKLNVEVFKLMLNRAEDYRMRLSAAFNPGYSLDVLRLDPEIEKKRKAMLAKNKERLDSGDLDAMTEVDNMVASEMIKKGEGKDEALDYFLSGASPSIQKHILPALSSLGFKPNLAGGMDLITSNLSEGIRKRDVVASANVAAVGAIARAMETADGGYASKKLAAIYQGIEVTAKDCGSTTYVTYDINKANSSKLVGRWVKSGSKLVVLTNSNIASYIGKKVQMRSPKHCKTKKGYCEVCTGEMYRKLGIRNIGLTMSGPSGQIGQLALKKTHQLGIEATTITSLDEFFTIYDDSKEKDMFSEEAIIESYDDRLDSLQDNNGDNHSNVMSVDVKALQLQVNNGLTNKNSLLAYLDMLIEENFYSKVNTLGSETPRAIKVKRQAVEDGITETPATRKNFKERENISKYPFRTGDDPFENVLDPDVTDWDTDWMSKFVSAVSYMQLPTDKMDTKVLIASVDFTISVMKFLKEYYTGTKHYTDVTQLYRKFRSRALSMKARTKKKK